MGLVFYGVPKVRLAVPGEFKGCPSSCWKELLQEGPATGVVYKG